MTARDIKCIRCKQLWTSTVEEPFQDWEIINDDHGRVCVSERYYRPDYWHWFGLCPDCQLPEKSPEELSEKAYKNVIGCYTTLEKRVAKLEHESERHEKGIQQNEINRRAGLNAMHDALLSRFDTRIAKLERESERIWEMIQRLGSIIE